MSPCRRLASPDMLKTAKLHALESEVTVEYQESYAEAFVETHASQFDVVTCFEMIEHVPTLLGTK